MVKEIIYDNFILGQISSPATKDDIYIAFELLETIEYHKDRCVGMAANMIGYLKTILVYLDDDLKYKVMINPKIIEAKGKYLAKEGCLCHKGENLCERYQKIKVEYQDMDFKKKIKTYKGFTAEIIEHELDHFKGILI